MKSGSIKKSKAHKSKLEEDLEFARRTEEAYKRYERGEFISMPFDKFIKKLFSKKKNKS